MTRNRMAIALLAIMLFAAFANAQDEVAPFTSFKIEKVHPAYEQDYIEGTKKWIEAIKEANLPLHFFTIKETGNLYSYGVMLNNMAEMDTSSEHWKKAADLLRSTEWGKRRQAAIKWSQYTVWMYGAELSYHAENPDLLEHEALYTKSINFHVPHANEAAFYKVMMELKELYEAKGVRRSYYIYRNILGEKGPLYTAIVHGKNPSELFLSEEKSNKALGQEAFEIFSKLDQLIIDHTQSGSWMLFELSNFEM